MCIYAVTFDISVINFSRRFRFPTIQIMHQHAGVGDVVGVEIGDFKVIGRFGRFKLLQRYAFYFAERSVGEKDFVAALQVAGGNPLFAQARIACMLQGSAVLPHSVPGNKVLMPERRSDLVEFAFRASDADRAPLFRLFRRVEREHR